MSHPITAAEADAASRAKLPPAQAFDLFPTRIWQIPLAHLAPQFATWVHTTQALRAAAPVPAGRTNRGGWNSTDHAVLHQSVFADLHQTVRDYCQQAFAEMGQGSPAFTLQSWINIHDRGGFNFQHMHEGALLSGTFYLQVPPGSGVLVFKDPRPGVQNTYARGNGANAYKDIQLRPSAGLLVLFPNWLEHFVEPHESDVPRICIPFNALRAR
jgi:uncharacterized protein (TIGR02466 family)